jgi:hypothetical protein
LTDEQRERLVLGARRRIRRKSQRRRADLPLVFADYGMPAAPGTTHLCGGNLFGEPTSAGRQEIVWDALASSSSPEALMRFYRARLGERGLIRTRIGGAWQLPSRDAHPRAMLEIAAPDA